MPTNKNGIRSGYDEGVVRGKSWVRGTWDAADGVLSRCKAERRHGREY